MMLLALAGLSGELRAQNLISVPFTDGFIGTRGSSAGSANGVLTYATLGIARTFFIQNSSTNTFELQGNDIPGTLRIVRTDGTTLDIPASANWRMNTGSITDLIGILPRPTSPITLTYSGGSIQITDGSAPGGSSIGGYVAAYAGAVAVDGASVSGNAAQSQVLDGLNSYLSTVVASRPAGPVTTSPLTTTSTTPTITGSATLAAGEALSVVVNGVEYTASSTPAVVSSGTSWSLALTAPLAVGSYDVTATVTNADGFTLSDATSAELVIASAITTVTIGGSFTVSDRAYDGTVAATGASGGLTLVGVTAPDEVTVASVTLAFQTAAAGSDKTVVITGVTLGGADAGSYSVSLTGAPTATATISAKALTITGVSAVDRVYDGTTTAALTGTAAYVGLASGESFAVAGTPAASFATAAAGTGKAVTVSGYAAPGANYTVAQPTGLTASIAPKALTIGGSFTVADRSYDGTTAATIATSSLSLAGVVGGDDVVLTGVTAAFADAAVGSVKPVTLSAASLTGAAAGNYTLSLAGAPTTTASILDATPPASPDSTPPSAPTDVAVIPGDHSLAITWTAPDSAGCGAITGYLVEYSTDEGQSWTRVTLATPSPTAATLPGLATNVAHLVRVAAVNACGTGAYSAVAGPVLSIAPTLDGTGRPTTSEPGTATGTTDGAPQSVTLEVVEDTIVRLTADDVALQLRASDRLDVAIPVDAAHTLLLDRGGLATAEGSGFAPGTFATVYLVTAAGEPSLLGTVEVGADETFAATLPIPDTLPAGDYTLQVNGVDRTARPRFVGVGVAVVDPPADLVLTAAPDEPSPAIGDTITITLTVTNQGPGPALDVVIPRAFHEPGFALVGATPLEGSYDAVAQEWTIGRIEPGARARMLLSVIVLPPAAPSEPTP